MRKYTEEEVKDLLKWFELNGILLVLDDSIGDVELPEVDEGFIYDELIGDEE